MAGEQIGLYFKMMATPAMLADGAYNFATYNGIPPFLPDNLSPSDLPYFGEFLDSIDPWDHTAHLTKETIAVKVVTHYPNDNQTGLDTVKFFTYKA